MKFLISNLKFRIKSTQKLKGFTIIEVLLTIAILAIIFGFMTLNLGRVTRVISVSESVNTLISDMRAQQEKAMSGAGDGTTGSSFGIYFQSDRYTLFRGTSYSSSDTSNVTNILDKNITFTNITFPQSTLVFSELSGEVSGYSAITNKVTVHNSAGGEQKTIEVNRYGVVDQVN